MISLLGLSNRRLDLVLSLVVLAVIVGSRLAAFPASVWEQDEAYFVAAVHQFDVTDSRPHPPWFPLWIVIGKVFASTGLDPGLALRIPALLFSLWIFIPLRAFWRRFLSQSDATAAALLFVATPAAWWFSGRAFSGVGGTAMLVTGLACWFADRKPSRAILGIGSAVGAAAVLVRPHLCLPVAAALTVGLLRRSGKEYRVMLIPGVLVLAVGVVGLVVASGGLGPLAVGLSDHAAYHFGRLSEAKMSFSSMGLARALGHPLVAAVWIGLSVVGTFRFAKDRGARTTLVALVSVLLVLFVVTFGLSNPAHARYFLPLLALTAGLVVGALGLFWRWGGLVGTLVAVAVATAWLVPELAQYRSVESPPVRAIRRAVIEASRMGAVVVVDATLDAFVKREQALGRPAAPIILWPLIEEGAVAAPPPRFTVTVTDRASGSRPITADSVTAIASDLRVAAVLGQDRYLTLDVATGARLRRGSGTQRPLVVVD